MANEHGVKLPEDLETERGLIATIGGAGADEIAASVIPLIKEDYFSHPHHREIFKAIAKCVQDGVELSLFSITDAMGEAGKRFGGLQGLVPVLSCGEVEKPEVLVAILAKKYKARRLIKISGHLMKLASDEIEDVDSVIGRAASALSDLSTLSSDRPRLAPVADVVEQIIYEQESEHNPGVMTGKYKLDQITQGFQPGQLIILAARPGIGKTTMALDWVLNVILHHGPVHYYSPEMCATELVKRMACNRASIPATAVKRRALNQYQKGQFYNAIQEIRYLPLHINDSSSITASEIVTQSASVAARTKQKPALVVVDHLGLVSSPDSSRNKSEAVRIGEISRAFKTLAKDNGCPVVALSQLNREIEKEDRPPRLSDLRDSGCIEQDADIVMFIHRLKIGPEGVINPTDLVISKHRDGELDKILYSFNGGYCRYEEANRETNPDSPATLVPQLPIEDEW